MNQQAAPAEPAAAPAADTTTAGDGLAFEATPTPTPVAEPAASAPTASGASTLSPELAAIKQTALQELRPLVDKLDVAPDEKFDTLLLLIRSTDDKTLVADAHEAARAIPDEAKRAQALLDVIKEIDYFSGQGQPAA
jgi:hypothetical protein